MTHNADRKAFRTKDTGVQKVLIEPLKLSLIHLEMLIEKNDGQKDRLKCRNFTVRKRRRPDLDVL